MIRNTRQAIQTALAHAYLGATNTAQFMDYCCPIDNSPGNAAYMMANSVQMAKVRAAVNGQVEHIACALTYNYGPDVQASNKHDRQAVLASMVFRKAFNGHYRRNMHDRLKAISWLSVEDFRTGLLMHKEMPVSVYLESINYSGSQWARDYEPRRREALMLLKEYDSDGVANVSVVVREICKSEEDS